MKKIYTIILAGASYLTLAPSAFAQAVINPCPQGTQFDIVCRLTDVGRTIGFVISIAFILAILIALFFLIYGGIKWITSGGDKGGVEAARNQIIAAVIGLIIVFLSFFILNLVLNFFGISLINIQIPRIAP